MSTYVELTNNWRHHIAYRAVLSSCWGFHYAFCNLKWKIISLRNEIKVSKYKFVWECMNFLLFFFYTLCTQQNMSAVRNWSSHWATQIIWYRIYGLNTLFFSWKYTKAALINSKNTHSYFKTTSNTRATVLHNSRKNID